MSKYQAPLNWYTGGSADSDVNETEEWLTAFEQVIEIEGRERACFRLPEREAASAISRLTSPNFNNSRLDWSLTINVAVPWLAEMVNKLARRVSVAG